MVWLREVPMKTENDVVFTFKRLSRIETLFTQYSFYCALKLLQNQALNTCWLVTIMVNYDFTPKHLILSHFNGS